MEGFVRKSLLYDFYGDLLTEHQKDIYGAYVLENLTLAEIAIDEGVSRQAVHDIIKRTDAALEEYESKLRLVERFLEIRERVRGIQNCKSLEEAKTMAAEITDML